MSQLSGIKISTPTFNDVIPSTGKKIKLTPFKVGDEKTLLLASESKETKAMVTSLKVVISNCMQGEDVDNLAPFDLEYLFLKLRSISVGETSDISLKCTHCDWINDVTVDISQAEVKGVGEQNKIVKITEDFGFEMKYPDPEESADIKEDVDGMMTVVVESIDKVFTGDEVINVGPAEKDDLRGILESLTTAQFKLLKEYFDSTPKLSKDIHFECESCNKSNDLVLEGLASFF